MYKIYVGMILAVSIGCMGCAYAYIPNAQDSSFLQHGHTRLNSFYGSFPHSPQALTHIQTAVVKIRIFLAEREMEERTRYGLGQIEQHLQGLLDANDSDIVVSFPDFTGSSPTTSTTTTETSSSTSTGYPSRPEPTAPTDIGDTDGDGYISPFSNEGRI